jgi:hypothetical protein
MAASRRCNLEAVGQLPASHPTLNAIRSDRYLAAYGPQLPTTKPVVTELFSGLSLVKNGNIFSEGRRFSAENIQEPTGVISREGRSVAKTRYWRAFSLILCRSQKIPDWMAGDAVVITPVSPQIPLLTGKFNRNFAYLARERLNPTREARSNSYYHARAAVVATVASAATEANRNERARRKRVIVRT